jgi:DNA-binding transcriptional MerR regulator
MTETPEPSREYTIDELAAISRVPSRTIRFYQSAGALKKPVIKGRVAYYQDAHLERLKLIADLQDRGLRIKAICGLVEKVDRGELDLNEWLGFEGELGASWVNENPRVVDEPELEQLIGGRRPGVLAELLRLKLIRREGESFLIRSPGLLKIAIKLESAGVDLQTASESASIIRKYASRAAKDLAEHIFKRAREGFGHDAGAVDLKEAFGALRPLSQEALRLIFGQEMDRVMREQIESGKTASIAKKKKKKKV